MIISGQDTEHLMDTQPLRNKICHGEQLNYGTQEHAIKAILSVDLMVNIANAINYN